MSISFALGSQRKLNFRWNMGFIRGGFVYPINQFVHHEYFLQMYFIIFTSIGLLEKQHKAEGCMEEDQASFASKPF